MASINLEARNRFCNAPKNTDYTIDQDWSSYSAAKLHAFAMAKALR